MQANASSGAPLHFTANDTSPNDALVFVSEDFCLPVGAWTVKMNLNGTHPEMAPFGNETHPEPCPGSGAANWNASSFVTGECRSWETITYESPSWMSPGAASILTSPAPRPALRYQLGDLLLRVARGG